MSNPIDKPPVDARYAEALAGQRKELTARRYVFRAERTDGIQVVFHILASDSTDAFTDAKSFCDARDWALLGRVSTPRSAFDRAQEEAALS